MMTEERRKELVDFCENVLAAHVQWGGDSDEEDLYKFALAALTQTASPALKLPDELQEKETDYQNLRDEKRGFNTAIAEVKRLNARHTAPIEPICATGGAEWVKVSDVEIEQELISLQNGNGQLRGESFYREALKELLAMRSMPIPDEFLNAQQNASGMFEISEDCMCQLLNMLCSKP